MTYNLILTLCIMLNCYIDNTTFYQTSTNWASQTNYTGYPSSPTYPSSSTRLQQTEYYGTQAMRIRANMFKNTAGLNVNILYLNELLERKKLLENQCKIRKC